MKNTIAMVSALALTIPAGASLAQVPDPGAVYVDNITHAGSDCPLGTVSVAAAPEQLSVQLTDFIADLGPGVPPAVSKATCQVSFTLHVPANVTFAVDSVAALGTAILEDGVTALIKWGHRLSPRPQPPANTPVLGPGPLDGDWTLGEEVDPSALVWSPCGVAAHRVTLSFQAMLRRAGPAPLWMPSGYLSLGDSQNPYTQRFGLAWGSCGAKK